MKVICENYQKCKVEHCPHGEWHEKSLSSACDVVPCVKEGGIVDSLCVENVFINVMKKTIKEECAT